MFNHLRTCLLNRPPAEGGGPDTPGEEPVWDRFVPAALVGQARLAHRVVFGGDPDRAYRNWRLRELLGVVHASELAADALIHDPRVTYLPRYNDAGWLRAGSAWATGPAGLTLLGTPTPDDAAGRIHHRFRLEVVDGATARVLRLTAPVGEELVPVPAAAGLAGPVPLGGSGVRAVFPPTPGQAWEVEALARPGRGLGAVAAALAAAVGDGAGLFPDRPPFDRWGAVWRGRPEPGYRAAAAALAVAEHVHERGGYA